MRAAVYKRPKELAIEDIPDREVVSGSALVKIEYCGICGSDLHAYLHGPQNTVMQKKVMGHEWGGVVEAVGEGVSRLKVGDKVTGIGIGGAFAERWVYPEGILHKLPDSITTRDGSLVEPLAVALRGVNRSNAAKGERIAVLGAGPIGLLAIAVLKSRGFDDVIVSEPDPARRELAVKMGAREALEPSKFGARARELTGFDGFNLVFECAGMKVVMDEAMSILGRGGRVLVLGAFTEPYPLTIFNFLIKEITVIPSFGYVDEFAGAIELMANRTVDPSPIVSHEIGLDSISDGFAKLSTPGSGAVKILVKIG